MARVFIILIINIITIFAAQAEQFTLTVVVTDWADGDPLCYATVRVGKTSFVTDVDGKFSLRLNQGRYPVFATYVGYQPCEEIVDLNKNIRLDFRLNKSDKMLQEVVVTARESGGLTTGSRIDRDAMQHLQPSSFTDLLELIPGNVSQDPNMGSVNSITLRETGTVSATGKKTSVSDDYATTSLGTSFIVDGTPINNDAGMQGIPDPSAGSAEAHRSTVNRGVDMRTISTDNIESVDIVRGIPSAEYGNLTSGLVNIKRVRRATPLSVRFKADEFSKLFALGKGVAITHHDHIINADLSWLDSKIDPRDNLETYRRLSASVRGNFRWNRTWGLVTFNAGGDYTGSFDNAKIDPDLNFNKIDWFKSSYNRYALTSEMSVAPNRDSFFTSYLLNASVSLVDDITELTKQVAPQRASVAPTSMYEGVHDGVYLLKEYIADFRSESRPFSSYVKLKATGEKNSGAVVNQYKCGMEWTLTKNYGAGQIYDLTRPLSASWTTRPRKFSDIPTLQTLSFFAEDNSTVSIGSNSLQMQTGVRGVTLPGLDRRYSMSRKFYLDPRVNVEWTFPNFSLSAKNTVVRVAAGYGLTSRMPTVDYLYPQQHYADMIQLNYYDVINPDTHSRINLRTYIEDAANYDLRPARNRKLEARISAEWGANRLSITYFDERMSDGFRYSSMYTPRAYRRYDTSTIDASVLLAPPVLEDLIYEDRVVLDGMRKVTNGSRIDKRGVEFQINTARWQPLHTSLIISGAWFKSRYSNSQKLYYPVNDVVGDRAVSDFYIGIYDSNDGRVNEQFNTNFMFDTQVPLWGLTFTSSIQCQWYLKTTRLRENGVPVQYLANDGCVYPYAEVSQQDVMLQYLVRKFNDDAFRTVTVPLGVYFNIKATKQIGRHLRISAFVNRVFDYLPDYKSNGITIRRSSDAYFGMEAYITI